MSAQPSKRLLLLSNSTQAGSPYLQVWKETISSFLKDYGARNVVFIPFAGISINWDKYTNDVKNALADLNITGIHTTKDMQSLVQSSEAIVIGGGNTFHLLDLLQKYDLLDVIRDRVNSGVPYVGWSAGSNVAGPDVGTTNDMPVVWPVTADALNLFPYNINPHYQNWKPPKYRGEGRDERLNEAIVVKKRPIVALSEGTAILVEGATYSIVKSPKKERDETKLVVKIWKYNSSKDKEFEVVDVDLGDDSDPQVPVPLNKYLEK